MVKSVEAAQSNYKRGTKDAQDNDKYCRNFLEGYLGLPRDVTGCDPKPHESKDHQVIVAKNWDAEFETDTSRQFNANKWAEGMRASVQKKKLP